MAYNLNERFPRPPEPFRLLEPGAYQYTNSVLRPNKVPFLSTTERNTGVGAKLWTSAVYDGNLQPKIPECTSFLSKIPRFPYQSLSKEDLEAILCQCGIENQCECDIEEKKDIICQGKVQRKLFKGPAPKSTLGEGISAPSKRDKGFKILLDGTKLRIFKTAKEDCPPFYDTRVIESTAFYQGCKWGMWTSKRGQKQLEAKPSPADYTIENKPNYETVCAEKVRASKRKTSKQYRFIEMVQRRDIIEGRPGPADYTPNLPKGLELTCLGPRAERFTVRKYDLKPGPNEYNIKRDFDKVKPPLKPCHVKLPSPPFFGIKAARFKPRCEEGPSPASYNTAFRPCQSKCVHNVPFGSSTERFQKTIIYDSEDEVISNDITTGRSNKPIAVKKLPMCVFRSKTIRMKPLVKKLNEPSPADLPQKNIKATRLQQLHYNNPFFSSEARFQPWFNWIPVFGKDKYPGPAYYCLEKPKCLPAVNCGPTTRTRRFPNNTFQTPAPNSYRVAGGIENILATHNQKLKNNIAKQHQYHWSLPEEPKKFSLEDQESLLILKCIALLDVHDIFELGKLPTEKSPIPKHASDRTKLLRCFMESRQIKTYF